MPKKSASAQAVAREARDMRERRDVDRLDSHLVLPTRSSSLSRSAILRECSPVILDVRAIEFPMCHNSFSAA